MNGETKYFLNNFIEEKKHIEHEYYPTSSAQKRIYILSTSQFEGSEISYNIPAAWNIQGLVDKNKIFNAFKKLTERHESLRTSFEIVDGEVMQCIHKDVEFKLLYQKAKENQINQIINEFIQPFDLSQMPLFRIGLLELSKDKYIMLLDVHHIIADGVSMDVIIKEFADLYEGKEPHGEVKQYKDFAVLEDKMLKQNDFQEQEEYWISEFKNNLPVLNMPLDYSRPSMQSFEGANVYFEASAELTRNLYKLATQTKTTLFMVLMASYNVLLSKYTGQEDIVVGSPIAGRPFMEFEETIGMFVNTLAYRNYPKRDITFKEFLSNVRIKALDAYDNQNFQFERLVHKLGLKRDMSRNPLFDTVLSLQYQEMDKFKIDNLTFSTHEFVYTVSKFDFMLYAIEEEGKLCFNFEYCTKLFKEDTIKRLSEHFIRLLELICVNIDVQLKDIEILSEKEKICLLYDFNNTTTKYPKDKTLNVLFEEQVKKTPKNTSIVYNGNKISYRELNEKANRLARILREKGVCPDELVGIIAERSDSMIIGVIAILKAGGAYLPIDLNYPENRIRYMIKDSNIRCLLTEGQLKDSFDFSGEIIDIHDELLNRSESSNLENVNKYNNLAYVMYTSGSTGRPKGVMIEHRNVVRLVKNTNYITFEENDCILQTGAVAFDASTFEIWGALLNGLTLYLVSNDDILDALMLKQNLLKNKITTLWLTAPLFNQMVQQQPDMFDTVKNLIVGGDVLSVKHINMLRMRNNNIRIINGYGPTENTTFSTYFTIDRKYEERIPIGKPISNSTVYILDECRNLMPIGVPGELCVGGDGVARGYLNSPELTSEKFVPDLLNADNKMYRTGDLARWLPDGTIEFLGRIDQQVKIRGFRIEVEEIESIILKDPLIKEAVVVDDTDGNGNRYLCAYIVADSEIIISEIKMHLSKELPDYMIPSYFIVVDKIPLTQNGKINKDLLPKHQDNLYKSIEYTGPSSEVEEKLIRLWEEVLGINGIGINHNFFELGGYSLKATILISKIRKVFNIKVPLGEIFKKPTIKEFAELISTFKKNKTNLSDDSVILLKYYTEKAANLFLIHDGSGDIGGYIYLSSLMKCNLNCWGIKANRLESLAPENYTMEDMVKGYIEKIKAIQPEGPYYIAGWSMGGIIAFEITKQLEAKGEKVDYLGFIDSPAPGEYIFENSCDFTLRTETEYVKKNLPSIKCNKLLDAINIKDFWNNLIADLDEKELQKLREIVLQDNENYQIIPNHDKLSGGDLIYYLNLIRTLNNTRSCYQPTGKIKAKVYFFWANEGNIKETSIDKWCNYCLSTVKNYFIDGNHFFMLKKNQVEKFAKIFEETISENLNK